MSAPAYDERQMANRNRGAVVALLILAVLVMVNGWITDEAGPWGTGLQQSMTVVMPAMAFFAVWNIWTGAYLGRRQSWGVTFGIFALLVVVYLIVFVRDAMQGRFEVWVDGHAGQTWLPLVMFGFFVAVLAAGLLRRWLDARASDE